MEVFSTRHYAEGPFEELSCHFTLLFACISTNGIEDTLAVSTNISNASQRQPHTSFLCRFRLVPSFQQIPFTSVKVFKLYIQRTARDSSLSTRHSVSKEQVASRHHDRVSILQTTASSCHQIHHAYQEPNQPETFRACLNLLLSIAHGYSAPRYELVGRDNAGQNSAPQACVDDASSSIQDGSRVDVRRGIEDVVVALYPMRITIATQHQTFSRSLASSLDFFLLLRTADFM